MSMNKLYPKYRYNISNIFQLNDCLSNNSRDLKISVIALLDSTSSNKGTIVRVNHRIYGTLFACTVDCSGPIFSDIDDMSISDILIQLQKFGFNVTYEPRKHLNGDQIMMLMKLQSFGFDKLRTIAVESAEDKVVKSIVVAFSSEHNPRWLDLNYTVSDSEFKSSLSKGYCLNLDYISKSADCSWDWLNYIANVDDVLKDNAGGSDA